MNVDIKNTLEMLVLEVSNLRTGGIVDAIRFCNQAVNYLIYKGRIDKSEKRECCQYICDLFNMGFHGSIHPAHIQLFIQQMMSDDYFDKNIMTFLH